MPDLGQLNGKTYRNVHFRLFTYVPGLVQMDEVQDQKADGPRVREPIDQRSKEPKISNHFALSSRGVWSCLAMSA
jgi:hypothetical protein